LIRRNWMYLGVYERINQWKINGNLGYS
jgi:hypothetical protein